MVPFAAPSWGPWQSSSLVFIVVFLRLALYQARLWLITEGQEVFPGHFPAELQHRGGLKLVEKTSILILNVINNIDTFEILLINVNKNT